MFPKQQQGCAQGTDQCSGQFCQFQGPYIRGQRRQWHPLQYSCLENPMDGGAWWAAVHGVAKSWTQLSDFTFTFHFHALEREMETHSSVLAWRIPGMGEPGGLPSMGLHRVGHYWSDLAVQYIRGGDIAKRNPENWQNTSTFLNIIVPLLQRKFRAVVKSLGRKWKC